MAIWTDPTRPARIINSINVSASSNQVMRGSSITLTCSINATFTQSVATAQPRGQLLQNDFSSIIGLSGSRLTLRNNAGSIRLTVGRNSNLIGRTFFWDFLITGTSVIASSPTITIIDSVDPITPNPSPDTCYTIEPDINWSGKFVYFSNANLVTYPYLTWHTDGQISTDGNVNRDDRTFFPL